MSVSLNKVYLQQSPTAVTKAPPPHVCEAFAPHLLSSCLRSNWNAMMVVQYIPKIFCCTYSTATPAPHTSHAGRKQDNPGELLSILTAEKRGEISSERWRTSIPHQCHAGEGSGRTARMDVSWLFTGRSYAAAPYIQNAKEPKPKNKSLRLLRETAQISVR